MVCTNHNISMYHPKCLGCTWKEECKKVNETWKDGCHHFQCVWSNTDTGFVAVINATNVCKW